MKYILIIACLGVVGCATPELETRTYRVGEIFWTTLAGGTNNPSPAISDAEQNRSFEEFVACCFPWPDGAFATLNKTNSTVTLRNTPRTLRRMERWLGPMDGSGVFYEEQLE